MAAAKLRIDLEQVPEELRAGLREIVAHRPESFCPPGSGPCSGGPGERCHVDMTFRHDPALGDRLALVVDVDESAGTARIAYGQKAAAFRALGRLLGQAETGAGEGGSAGMSSFREESPFRTLGMMVDVSRNGVLRLDAAQQLLRCAALMGINACMLYTEDTYEVPGEPFFGYLRGGYTQSELRALDDYAFSLGIAMIPCIQTLGHLEQILQWPAFSDLRDTAGVLLAEDERTYTLVEKMILAAAGPFRSRRIHVGMDEAWGIGTGRYRDLHGDRRPFDILNAHLARVREICLRHGLRPMIWSDMYFRLGSRTHEYYDREAVIPEDVKKAIPPDVDLVYWDYYHLDSDFYQEWIDRHRELGSEPVVAGGVWTWNRLWAALPFSFAATDACMTACKRRGVREVLVTMWGDDGMECDIFSALPGLQYFAEHGYTPQTAVDEARVRRNFRGACGAGADFDDWVRASAVDAPPGVDDPRRCHGNPGKWLLWQDPLLALMDPLVEGLALRPHYETLAQELLAAAEKRGRGDGWARRLLLPGYLARVLALKSELRRRLAAAYAKGDRATLRQMAATDIPALRAAVLELWKVHRETWMSTYRPFGWEVIERRYGGLQARLATLAEVIAAYLDGRVERIPELEARLQQPVSCPPGTLPEVPYARVATPSAIK